MSDFYSCPSCQATDPLVIEWEALPYRQTTYCGKTQVVVRQRALCAQLDALDRDAKYDAAIYLLVQLNSPLAREAETTGLPPSGKRV